MQRQPSVSELAIIGRLVGEATPEQLRYVECFIAEPVSLFVPAVGPCQYALSRNHAHPGYSFVLAFDRNTGIVVEGRTIYSEPGRSWPSNPRPVTTNWPGMIPRVTSPS